MPGFQFNTTSHPREIKISKPISSLNIKTYLVLFDSQIKHIMLYACEAWADPIKGDVGEVKFLSSNKHEKLQINIFKQLLGVSRKTTNLAILLELGRYTITIYRRLNISQGYLH